MQARLDRMPDAMGVRRQTVEHPFGTFKSWMGSTHFLTRTLKRVRTEMSLHVLAYNMKRVIAIIGVGPLLQAIRARVPGSARRPAANLRSRPAVVCKSVFPRLRSRVALQGRYQAFVCITRDHQARGRLVTHVVMREFVLQLREPNFRPGPAPAMAATRRLAATSPANVAGYSRLMGADEEGTHERLKAHFGELVNPKIAEHRGRIRKNTGDGLLAEIPECRGCSSLRRGGPAGDGRSRARGAADQVSHRGQSGRRDR
jgi:hypothetical protein